MMKRFRWQDIIVMFFSRMFFAVGAYALMAFLITVPAFNLWVYKQSGGAKHLEDASVVIEWMWSGESTGDLANEVKGGTFNDKELRHYGDVRSLIVALPFVGGIGIGVSLLMKIMYLRNREKVVRAMWFDWYYQIVISVLIVLGALSNFKAFFNMLHKIVFNPVFFEARSWLLPSGSYSLVLFSKEYWFVLTLVLFGGTLLLSGIICFGGGWMIKKVRRR